MTPRVSPTTRGTGRKSASTARWEVSTFLRMIARNPAVPQRVLVFQVPQGKGKSKLLIRYNVICQLLATRGERILHALIDFRDRGPAPSRVAVELVDSIIENAQKENPAFTNSLNTIHSLRNRITEYQSASSGRKGRQSSAELQLYELARDIHVSIESMTTKWTVVLLLDTFEHLVDRSKVTCDWLLGDFLNQSGNIAGFVVVLAGQRGLDKLAGAEDRIIFRANARAHEGLGRLQAVRETQVWP